MEWEYQRFGRWLRKARVDELPVISQDKLADILEVPQSIISRWEKEKAQTRPPTLRQCGRLADLFDVDAVALARACGQWDDEIQERILVTLASTDEARHAPVAQLPIGKLAQPVPVLRLAS